MIEKLNAEVELGERAQKAYDLYVKEFIEKVENDLYSQFCNANVSDTEVIIETKRLQAVVSALKTFIFNDIETGKLAFKQMTSAQFTKQ